jgi:hypothetical protein
MRTKDRRRRIVLFGGIAFALGTTLILAAMLANRDLFVVKAWTDYLGQSEKAAMEQSMGEDDETGEAPAILCPDGIEVRPLRTARRDSKAVTAYSATLSQQLVFVDPLKLVENHWRDKGLAVGRYDDRLVAREKSGAMLVACRADEPSGLKPGGASLLLWRLREMTEDEATGTTDLTEADYADLLPSPPPDAIFTQLGREGKPGYTLSITVGAPATTTLNAMVADMRKRGWEPYDLADGEGTRRLKQVMPGTRAVIFRHETAPIGCQLLVRANMPKPGHTQILLALF